MKHILIILIAFSSLTATADIVNRAYKMADLIEQYQAELTRNDKVTIRKHLRSIQNIVLSGSTDPGSCDPAVYKRAYTWAYKKWNGSKSEAFADTIMAQPNCSAYLDTYIKAYAWGYKRWNGTKSETFATEISKASDLKPKAFDCYVDAYTWAYKKWNGTKSEAHAKKVCL